MIWNHHKNVTSYVLKNSITDHLNLNLSLILNISVDYLSTFSHNTKTESTNVDYKHVGYKQI